MLPETVPLVLGRLIKRLKPELSDERKLWVLPVDARLKLSVYSSVKPKLGCSSKLVVVAARKGSLKGPGTRVWDGGGGTGGMNGGSVGAAGADGAAAFSPPEAEG